MDRKRRAEDMLKKLVRFCGVTVKESPVLFGLNIVMMLFFIAMQLGMSYAFKLLTEVVVGGENLSGRYHAVVVVLILK